MFKHILVAYDGSDHANEALHVATDLAEALRAQLGVCYVVDVGRVAALTGSYLVSLEPAIEAMETNGMAVLQQAVEALKSQKVQTYLLSGFPPDEIVKCAREHGMDLIVMGSHGRSGVQRFIVGSVAEAVLRQSHTPVLVSRQKRPAEVVAPFSLCVPRTTLAASVNAISNGSTSVKKRLRRQSTS